MYNRFPQINQNMPDPEPELSPEEQLKLRLRHLRLKFADPTKHKTYNVHIYYDTETNLFSIRKIYNTTYTNPPAINVTVLKEHLDILLSPTSFVDSAAIQWGPVISIDGINYGLEDVSSNAVKAEEFYQHLLHLPYNVEGILYFLFEDPPEPEPVHMFEFGGGRRKTAAVKSRSPVRQRHHSVHKHRKAKLARTHLRSRSNSRKHRKQSKSVRRRRT
jgi:hypothetical protein